MGVGHEVLIAPEVECQRELAAKLADLSRTAMFRLTSAQVNGSTQNMLFLASTGINQGRSLA